MGNTVILKPASETPLTALRLGELAIEADIPPGVLNILVGSGKIVGNGLVSHPLVRKISFTGSTEVGIGIMKLAAAGIKRVTLELGGKSANLVFADADWAKAIDGALWSVLGNAGQDCCARSRLLVERAIYEPFVSELAQRFQSVRLGLPQDEATEMGPLISASHRETVRQYINIGLQEGATLKQGGEIPTNPELSLGFYLQPTLFTDVHPGGRIAQEEIFGPVLAVIPFETEAEALAIANNSLYGLSGSIWTKDLSRALRVAQAMETGVISINSSSSVHLEAPFGGVKQSGIGRELGLQALDHYSEQKTVFIATED
jgi:betaine-aldehyde dehydrogenase